jgi:hypothetical protein
MNPDVRIDDGAVPISEPESILQSETRDISILVAREDITITRARYAVSQQVARRHVHHQHTDAFYVLEGQLNFEIGCERPNHNGLPRRVRRPPAGGGPLLRHPRRSPRALANHPYTRRRLRRLHARRPRRPQRRVGHRRSARQRRPASKRSNRHPAKPTNRSGRALRAWRGVGGAVRVVLRSTWR